MDPSKIIQVDDGPDDSGDESDMKSDKTGKMFVHVGGRLVQDNGLKYVDGECNYWRVNPDKLTRSEFYKKLELSKYDPEMVDGIWNLQPQGTLESGLVQIVNEESVREVQEILNAENVIHIYVFNIPDFAFLEPMLPLPIPSDEQREENENVGDRDAVNEEGVGVETHDSGNLNDEAVGVEAVDGENLNEGVGVQPEYGDNVAAGTQDNVHMEGDHIIDVLELTDNEDEETLQARKNMRLFTNVHDSIEKEHEQPMLGVNYDYEYTAGSSAAGPSTSQFNEDDEIGSDEEDSYISTSNEEGSEVENAKRRRATHKVYQDSGDDGIPDIRLGMVFVSKQQFRAAVDKWNLKDRRDIKWKKNDNLRCRAACVNEPECPWKILLAKDIPTESWIVKTFVSKHTCNWKLKKNKRCSSTVAAKYLVKKRGFTALYMKPSDIFTAIRREFSVELTYHQLKKVKEKIGKTFESDCMMEYGKLWDYAAELRSKDPAATIIIEAPRPTKDLNPVFLRMYICFSAMKLGFVAGCRRVIGLDGAFLKGPHKGILLVAISRDANDQMYPLAWAVMEAETTQTWTWFLEELQKDMKIGRGNEFTFISDQQKGLIHAIKDLFPDAEHRTCARHKYANFRKNNGGQHRKYCINNNGCINTR